MNAKVKEVQYIILIVAYQDILPPQTHWAPDL